MMWGGGDGSSDMQRGASSEAGVAGAGAAVGAASGGLDGADDRTLSEEEQIYGPQAGQASRNPAEDTSPYGDGDLPSKGYDDDLVPENEEVMDDPWADEPQDGGIFGGGGGDMGDWGDWS